jgi:hypothetical protein
MFTVMKLLLRGKHFRFLKGLLVGGGVVYFFDPQLGRGRRAKAREQMISMRRQLLNQAEKKVKYEAGKLEGEVYERIAPESAPDGSVLKDKVQSTVLGQERFHDLPVNLEAREHDIVVRGEVPDDATKSELEAAIRSVVGVAHVDMETHLPGQLPPNKADALHAAEVAPG